MGIAFWAGPDEPAVLVAPDEAAVLGAPFPTTRPEACCSPDPAAVLGAPVPTLPVSRGWSVVSHADCPFAFLSFFVF